ncbi:DoxX family membrane protein, partial [Candidatus Poribacteria bacterium]|nr:DoxX family membrane protein [Candidatus Poribacteria bacterium]
MKIPLILVTLLRVVLGGILLFAGITKLMGFSTFATNVGSYQMLPIGLVKPVSYVIVSAEITLGIVLIIGYFSRGAGILSMFLFLIFAVALTNALLQELTIADCGCDNFLFSLLDLLGFTISNVPNWKIVIADIVLAVTCLG